MERRRVSTQPDWPFCARTRLQPSICGAAFAGAFSAAASSSFAIARPSGQSGGGGGGLGIGGGGTLDSSFFFFFFGSGFFLATGGISGVRATAVARGKRAERNRSTLSPSFNCRKLGESVAGCVWILTVAYV